MIRDDHHATGPRRSISRRQNAHERVGREPGRGSRGRPATAHGDRAPAAKTRPIKASRNCDAGRCRRWRRLNRQKEADVTADAAKDKAKFTHDEDGLHRPVRARGAG